MSVESISYNGMERRATSRKNERMNIRPEEMATLIYNRRFRGQLPANLDEEQFSSSELKAAVQNLFGRPEGTFTTEQLAFREGLEFQAGAAASVWTERFPIENGPSQVQLETGAHEWLQSLTQQVLEGFRTLCPDTASLVVVPNLPVPALLKLLEQGGEASTIWWDFWKKVAAKSWKVGITNGAEDMPFDHTIYWKNAEQEIMRTNGAMVEEYKRRFKEQGLGIMPLHGYVPSAARALAQGKVLDREFVTEFEQPKGEKLLPCGGWGSERLVLDGNFPNNSYVKLRCRPWVEGEMNF